MRRLMPALLALALAGCSSAGGSDGGMTVVATTTHAADLARNVAGDRAEVVGLLPANADPHGYEVRPGDVRALADADVIVRSGGDLDDWLQDAIEGSGSDAPVVNLIDSVETHEGGHDHEGGEEHSGEEEHSGGEEHSGEEEHEGEEDHEGEEEHASDEDVDPHWWHDPRNAVLAVGAIRDALADADPERAAGYRASAEAYTAELRELDAAVAACIEQIPPANRKLVTTHDALGYYAERYGLEVVGAVIPSRSTQGQPSAGETAELVETIRAEGVPAIFAESSVDPGVEQAIAGEAGARVGDPLFADALAPGMTYVESMRANTRAIAEGLGAGSC